MRDGGIITLSSLENTGEAGFMPVQKLVPQAEPFFAYRTAGVTRRYAARGANAEFDFVVRCFNMIVLPDRVEFAVMEDGTQYRIDVAEPQFEEDAIDLTLVRLEDFYDVLTD